MHESREGTAVVDDSKVLIDRAAVGHPASLRILIRRLLPVIHARARRQLARWPEELRGFEPGDLVQEIWLALLKDGANQLRLWDPARGATLEGYVGMVAEREVGNLRQKNVAQKRGGDSLEVELDLQISATAPSPEIEIVGRDLNERLGSYLQESLPLKGQAVLRYLYTDELQPNEVAQALGINRQVVYNWQHKIRELVREFLSRAG